MNDSRGFFANRCVLAYILEGHLMLIEGIPPAMIENAGKQAGMPVGPLSLNDEVGLDLGLKILKATKAQLGESAILPEQEALLTRLVEGEGRYGRKNRKGFYDYPEGAPKRLGPGLKDLQTKHLDPELLDMQELKQRLLVTQALEAARTVEEGVITDPREADVGSILGFGFAPYTGGALSYIDLMGPKAFVELCKGCRRSTARGLRRPRLFWTWRLPAKHSTARRKPGKRRRNGRSAMECLPASGTRDHPMKSHLLRMAEYNAWCNQRVYDAVLPLSDAEYREDRGAFFKSIYGTLNHLLATDRIWMKRFTGEGEAPTRLDAVLYEFPSQTCVSQGRPRMHGSSVT